MFELLILALLAHLFCFFVLRHAGRHVIRLPWGPRAQWGVAVTPDLGHGAAITFQSGLIAKVLSIEWGGIERAAVETTVLDTSGGKTFMPGDNYDPGEITAEIQFDTDSAWVTALTAAAETVTLTFPDAETAAVSGFLTSFEITDITNEDVMKARITIKATGTITG